ncbi:amidohydrolase family protein [Chitinophaga agrisoli]|uniref:Amidohydrolase family protein n=1 Tax=Chitinophaga agrisoli TaxID=2607653 RepID=A0A5B2VNQ6_9BACT|nr:amidohydrolase family protein [Chitinophaga agrisoli]KAA2240016.1 amidohydrolase family protein [Chitinophaga agrisoli]
MKCVILPLAFVLVLIAFTPPRVLAQSAPMYDIVINGGRVIDPETKLDARRSIGIIGGTIAAISTKRLMGKRMINATGWIVAPGFIDLHSHGQSIVADRMQVFDGVTTALELDAGTAAVKEWYDTQAQTGRVLNYGMAAGWNPADSAATPTLARLEQGLQDGAPGIGIDSGDLATATLRPIYALAAKYKVPVFQCTGNKAATVQQIITLAAATGSSAHLCYAGSADVSTVTNLVLQAREKGLPITLETHTYGPCDTAAAAAQIAATARNNGGNSVRYPLYITSARNNHYTETPIDAYIDDALVLLPGASIGSGGKPWIDANTGQPVDAYMWPLPVNAYAPPAGAGTYTRLLGYWVRERKALSLSEAISKSSLLPARIMERAVPQLRKKGRLQKGMDADLIVFDPGTVRSMASTVYPYRPAAGVKCVIINGVTVITNGELELTRPGKAIRRAVAETRLNGRTAAE